MASYRIISSDSHVFEPRDLWTTRIEPKYRGREPRVARVEDGSDWWVWDGRKMFHMGAGAQAGVRFDEPEKLTSSHTFEDVRPGGYIPEEHVKDMDADGVDVGIVYPSAGGSLYSVPDSELLTALFRTYNDWLGEFCQPFPDRLKGIAMLNVDDVQESVRELERCAKLGLAGAMVSVYPPEERSYDSPEYEPLWAAAQDSEMPLSLHVGTNRQGVGPRKWESRYLEACFPVQPRTLGSDVPFSYHLQRRVRTLSETTGGDGGARAVLDSPFPGPAGLHLHAKNPEGLLAPVQGGHASQRLFPPQRVRRLPGRWPWA